MRLLMFLLTIVWAIFGWYCYSAIHWKKPIDIPLHVEDQLRIYTPEAIEAKIAIAKTAITGGADLTSADKGRFHFELAQGYWLKAFIQDTRVLQLVFLRMCLSELELSINNYPQEPEHLESLANVYYQAGDVHHVLNEYKKANDYYLKSLKINPAHPMTLRRYKQMIEESGLEDRSDL